MGNPIELLGFVKAEPVCCKQCGKAIGRDGHSWTDRDNVLWRACPEHCPICSGTPRDSA